MPELEERVYIGDGAQHYSPLVDEKENLLEDVPKKPEPYIPDPDLIEAVNVALYLRRPLLLEGEPGCGKTRLAHAVAYELGYPLKECYIRSTSHAQDLLYTYDAVRRLYDIQERSAESRRGETPGQDSVRGDQERKYVTLGKLGDAIRLAERNISSVVLIDEVDKADIDFPNDLLNVLDRLQFEIGEVEGWKIDALHGQERDERRNFLPLFLITSNREKELPKPFLRRCLYYYIDFPDKKELDQIVRKHFDGQITPLFEAALARFWEMRDKGISWRKPPSTSELLDWIGILERDEKKGKSEAQAQTIKECPLEKLPHLETLIKTQSDRNALMRMSKGDSDGV